MNPIIAHRHMQILEYLYEKRGYPQRGLMIEKELDLTTNSVYEYLKRLKRRGWVIVSDHTVVDQTVAVPFYTISPLGVSAYQYGLSERLQAES